MAKPVDAPCAGSHPGRVRHELDRGEDVGRSVAQMGEAGDMRAHARRAELSPSASIRSSRLALLS